MPPKKQEPQEFTGRALQQGVIAVPLRRAMEAAMNARRDVLMDLNVDYPAGGRDKARDWVRDQIDDVTSRSSDAGFSEPNHQYVTARLTGRQILKLVDLDAAAAEKIASSQPEGTKPPPVAKCRAIFRVWPDFEVSALLDRSLATIKADAACRSFASSGSGIVWAVLDTGVDQRHPHFATHNTLQLDESFEHRNFTSDPGDGLDDPNGHGTHVAGVIAGELSQEQQKFSAVLTQQNQDGGLGFDSLHPPRMAGVAPKCKILSLKVLDRRGKGNVSSIIAALSMIQEINGGGRRLRVQGVNLSLGHSFDPEWFACGQSPLCVEVNRLVKSGVVVVVAAGNSGYGALSLASGATHMACLDLTINDPGNADGAITVGSTHRHMPHTYGVSFFSSKGPTGDGRCKPDLVAPGEKILSCAAGTMAADQQAFDPQCLYVESSGTSMAAPHVSGALAAFLSVRQEFIGQPEELKRIFCESATDLKRDRNFQGAGLLDLMRALQKV